VFEPVNAWQGVLPANFWPAEGTTAGRLGEKGGGSDPQLRSAEMAQDGVIAEVLYPSRGLKIFAIEEPETQEAACRVYNEWLIDYCSVAPDRLLGVGMIPAYDTDRALEEIAFCHDAGFKGMMLWLVPHPDLPFRAEHYEPIWTELERRKLPLSFHILTGFRYAVAVSGTKAGVRVSVPGADDSPYFEFERLQRAVNLKTQIAMDLTLEFIMTGIFDRHPGLKIVFVENEIGWIPWAATQWDFYFAKTAFDAHGEAVPQVPLAKLPSGYFDDQVYATFFRDKLSNNLFRSWGADTFMWSSDFPHPNSTWPHSRNFIANSIGDLPTETLTKVLRSNAERLYGPVPDLGS
jgi:predicted TIM-barrel fold metal-dependent hydrolase